METLTEATNKMHKAEQALIEAIAASGDEKVQAAFLTYQDSQKRYYMTQFRDSLEKFKK